MKHLYLAGDQVVKLNGLNVQKFGMIFAALKQEIEKVNIGRSMDCHGSYLISPEVFGKMCNCSK